MQKNAQKLVRTGFPDSSIGIYKSSLHYSKILGYDYGIANSNLGIGVAESMKGNYEDGVKYYHTALQYCDTAQKTKVLFATIYNAIAGTYTFWGDYEEVIKYQQKAIAYRERFNSNLSLSMLYVNMGSTLKILNNDEKALYYFKKSELLGNNENDKEVMIRAKMNIASIYEKQERFDSSSFYYNAALQLSKSHDNPILTRTIYTSLANMIIRSGKPEQALPVLEKALSINTNDNPLEEASTLIVYATAALKLKDYNTAEDKLMKALNITERLQTLYTISAIYKLLSEVYFRKGNLSLAYQYQSQAWVLSDSINNKEKVEAVMRIETQYRTAQKDKEIAENQLVINSQQNSIKARNIGMVVAIIILSLLGTLLIIIRKNYKNKQALKDEKMERLLRQQQMSEMKAIINGEEKERTRIARDLHDGIMVRFSAAKMHISALIGDATRPVDAQKLMPVLDEMDLLASELRSTAHNLMPDMLLEEGLADAVHYFCNNLQKNTNISITFERLSNIPRFESQFELSVYRIIQELVQNIIKHAHAGEAYIQMNYDNQHLNITVEDDGIGMASPDDNKYSGMGIRSINARVLSLNGFMELSSKPGKGTSVNLEFDILPV